MKNKILLGVILLSLLTSCRSNLGQLVDAAHTQAVTPSTSPTITPAEPVSTIMETTQSEAVGAINVVPSKTPEKGIITVPKDAVTIMVLGSDYRPKGGYRTDTIILVTINKTTGGVSLLSFPRDLYVTLPGKFDERINTAMEFGGFELLQKTMEYNFHFVPDYYILTNMQGFIAIIDSLGGVTINSAKPLSDRCDLDWASDDGFCNVGTGSYTFDGASALWYVRARYSTSDFDRLRRAQEVMWGIFYRLMSFDGAKRIPEFYDAYKGAVDTNINLTQSVYFGSFLPAILDKPEKIKQYAITSEYTRSYRTKSGGAVQLPVMEKILPLLQQALNVQ